MSLRFLNSLSTQGGGRGRPAHKDPLWQSRDREQAAASKSLLPSLPPPTPNPGSPDCPHPLQVPAPLTAPTHSKSRLPSLPQTIAATKGGSEPSRPLRGPLSGSRPGTAASQGASDNVCRHAGGLMGRGYWHLVREGWECCQRPPTETHPAHPVLLCLKGLTCIVCHISLTVNLEASPSATVLEITVALSCIWDTFSGMNFHWLR